MMTQAEYLAHADDADDWAARSVNAAQGAEWTQMAVEWRRLAAMASHDAFWAPFIPSNGRS